MNPRLLARFLLISMQSMRISAQTVGLLPQDFFEIRRNKSLERVRKCGADILSAPHFRTRS